MSCLSQDECYNYIKVLVPRNDETLFACGTNAFNPTCRNYKVWWVYFCHTHTHSLTHSYNLLQMSRFLKLLKNQNWQSTCTHLPKFVSIKMNLNIRPVHRPVYIALFLRNELISYFFLWGRSVFSHQHWLLAKINIFFLQLPWAILTNVKVGFHPLTFGKFGV